jgi:TRAP-type C4-dicarboxylate transport system permease small subunit
MRLLLALEDGLAKLLLGGIVVLVFAAALGRTFGHPLIWSVDLAQLLFIWLVMLGANKALRIKAHVGVDYFVRKLPVGLRRWLEIALGLLTLAFLLTMAWQGARLTMLNLERVYGDSGISYGWVTGAVPAGCLLLAITLAAHIVRCLARGSESLVFARPNEEMAGAGHAAE